MTSKNLHHSSVLTIAIAYCKKTTFHMKSIYISIIVPHIDHNIKHTHVRLLSPLIVGTTPTHCTQQCIATELRTKRPTQMQYTSSTKDSADPSLQKFTELNAPLAETLRWNQVWQYFCQSRANNIFHKKKPLGCESMGVISCSAPFL